MGCFCLVRVGCGGFVGLVLVCGFVSITWWVWWFEFATCVRFLGCLLFVLGWFLTVSLYCMCAVSVFAAGGLTFDWLDDFLGAWCV